MRLAAVLLGAALYALALPPYDLACCGWLAVVPFVLALTGQTRRSAFWYGCLFGYASGWTILWPLVDAVVGYELVPPVAGVPGVALWFLVIMGVPFGLFAATATGILRWRARRIVPFVVATLWVASEMLRGRVFGQPWGLIGYTQHGDAALVQVAAVTGVYGIAFVMVAFGTAAALAVRLLSGRQGVRPAAGMLAFPALLVAACWFGGFATLRTAASDDAGRARAVMVVQTNLVPPLRWSASYTAAQIAAHVRATNTIEDAAPALIVWPEYAVPSYVDSDPGLASVLRTTARRHHADLLFGTPRAEDGRSYNSVSMVRADGRPGGHYDKRRLVWFAERMPLSTRADGFSEGAGPGVLTGFARLGVSICHEILHPDLIVDSVRHGAQILVNVANDSWLERSSDAPGLQHLAMASLRAVETHRYLIRAATTGSSAIIDPFGRIVTSLPTWRAGTLTGLVSPRDGETPYVRFGDAFGFACLLIAALVLIQSAVDSARSSAWRSATHGGGRYPRG